MYSIEVCYTTVAVCAVWKLNIILIELDWNWSWPTILPTGTQMMTATLGHLTLLILLANEK